MGVELIILLLGFVPFAVAATTGGAEASDEEVTTEETIDFSLLESLLGSEGSSGDGTEETPPVDSGTETVPTTLVGTDADDTITGTAANDTITGGAGADSLDGADGFDQIDGGAGDDTLLGGLGQDTLLGGAGIDLLQGGDGADQIFGGDGSDTLDGNAGADVLWGGAGADILNGGTGDDVLDGGQESGAGTAGDILDGQSGDDLIYLDNGDIGTGGLGADSFYANGVVQITDFAPGEDLLMIEYQGATAPQVADQSLSAGGLTLSLTDGTVVLLAGLTEVLDEASLTYIALAPIT